MSKVIGASTSVARRYSGRLTCAVVAALLSNFAVGKSPQTDETASLLGEITVTAQRKEESVQKAALSITAFSGAQARELGFTQPTELAVQTPGLTISSTIGDSNPIFTMRGIGLNDFSANNNPSTSVYIDEVSVPFSPMLGFQIFDMQRIEVLKGPQGTLYGRNTTGGAINFIAAQPSKELGGFLNVDIGSYQSKRFEGAIGGGLSDTVSVRASLLIDERDKGYQYNRFNNSNHGEVDRKSGRILVGWTPTSNVSLLLNLHAGKERSDNPFYDFHGFLQNDGTFSNPCAAIAAPNPNGCTDFLGFVEPDSDPYTVSADGTSFLSSDGEGASAKLKVDLDHFSMISVTGYDVFKRLLTEDYDATEFVQFNDTYSTHIHAFSQELRLVSNHASPFEWIVGAYYSRDTVVGHTTDLTDALGFRFTTDFDQKTTSKSLFAHAVFSVADALKVRAGLRYTNEEKSYFGGSDTLVAQGASFVSVGATFVDTTIKANDVSGELGLDWTLSDQALLYFTASRGFKSGGFSGGYSGNNAALAAVRPEKVYGLEIGSKLSFLSGKVRWNSALYRYDWRDFQARATATLDAVPILRLINAGKANIVGAETNLNWSPVDGLDIALGGNYYFKAKVVDSVDPTLVGNHLVNTPKFSLNGILRFQHAIGSSGISPYLQIDFNYQSESFFYITNKSDLGEDGYVVTNAKIGTKLMHDKFDVSLWVKNISDVHYKIGGFDSGGFTADPIFWSLPRTYGASFKYAF
jgi:iron complex outermembrane recepter protein